MNLRAKLGSFVLTAKEQRTIAFIVLALILGLATQHYRQRQDQSAPPTKTENATTAASPTQAKREFKNPAERSRDSD
jgi:hypothetical protein